MLPQLVGPTALQKDKVGLLKQETITSNARVHPPIETLPDKTRGS